MTVRIGEDDEGRRLDRVLRKYLPELPLSALHRLLRKGTVKLDGKKASPDARVQSGAELILPDLEGAHRSTSKTKEPSTSRAMAPQAPRIIFENDLLIIVNKDAGTITHGVDGVDQSVLAYLAGKLKPSLSFTPGPLHRLDRGTSGLITFSKSIEGARRFSAAIAERRLGKRYLAVLEGTFTDEEVWEDNLVRDGRTRKTSVSDDDQEGALKAYTEAVPLAWDGNTTLALIELGTGRTHQIRVQAAARKKPLLGDAKYGAQTYPGGFLLHSYELSDEGDPPQSDLIPAVLTVPPPERFLDFVRSRYGVRLSEILSRGLPSARLLNAIM